VLISYKKLNESESGLRGVVNAFNAAKKQLAECLEEGIQLMKSSVSCTFVSYLELVDRVEEVVWLQFEALAKALLAGSPSAVFLQVLPPPDPFEPQLSGLPAFFHLREEASCSLIELYDISEKSKSYF